MTNHKDRTDTPIMMQITGYLTVAAVAILGITVVDPGWDRWLMIALVIAFTTAMTIGPHQDAALWKRHFYIGVQCLFVTIMLTLQTGWSVFPILMFILAAQAMLLLPQKWGLAWIGILTLVTGMMFVINNGWIEGLLTLLPYTGGFIFFGAFASALAQAELAQARSEELLVELQAANQQLHQYTMQVEELAIAEERNRLAREMHDTIGHRLTVSAVQLEGAHKLVSRDPERAEQMIGVVREQVKDALTELRSTVATLREPLYSDLTLEAAVLRVIDSYDRASELQIETRITGDLPEVSDVYRIAFCRALQESLTNIHKHANAQNAWIDLAVMEGAIRLTVSDNGIGIHLDRNHKGFGMLGMRERAEQLGGEVSFSDNPEGGTIVVFSLPINNP